CHRSSTRIPAISGNRGSISRKIQLLESQPMELVQDRRARKRFPLRMGMLYRKIGMPHAVDWTVSESLDISSTGFLFTAKEVFSPGQNIEALIDWPARLNKHLALRLAVR